MVRTDLVCVGRLGLSENESSCVVGTSTHDDGERQRDRETCSHLGALTTTWFVVLSPVRPLYLTTLDHIVILHHPLAPSSKCLLACTHSYQEPIKRASHELLFVPIIVSQWNSLPEHVVFIFTIIIGMYYKPMCDLTYVSSEQGGLIMYTYRAYIRICSSGSHTIKDAATGIKRMPLCTDILPYCTFDLHGADRKQTRTQP